MVVYVSHLPHLSRKSSSICRLSYFFVFALIGAIVNTVFNSMYWIELALVVVSWFDVRQHLFGQNHTFYLAS